MQQSVKPVSDERSSAATRVAIYLTAAAAASHQKRSMPTVGQKPIIDAFASLMKKWVAAAGKRSRWNATGWRFTHRFAAAVRGELARRDQGAAIKVLNSSFAVLDNVIAALESKGPVRFEDLWPVLESLEQLAAVVAMHANPSTIFVEGCTWLVVRHPDPAVVCGIAWSVNELLERGKDSRDLARRVAAALVEIDSSDITIITFYLIAKSRPKDSALLPLQGLSSISTAGWALAAGLKHLADEASAEIRVWATDETASLDRFTELVSLLYVQAPFMGLTAMALLKGAFARLLTSTKFIAGSPDRVVARLCRTICAEIDRHVDAAFLITEACEAIRDKEPRACARAMAQIFRTASARVRQALAVCMAEGYEEEFRGVLQQRVPRFGARGSRVSFTAGGQTDLNVFCRSVAAQASHDPTGLPHLMWMNERLAGWQA